MPLCSFVSGEYQPSFFIMLIDSDVPVESVADENISTFTHEYIHFLQDLSLPYCMRENLARLNEFFAHIDEATAAGNVFLPSLITNQDVAMTARQSALTWGGSPPQKSANTILRVNQTQESFQGRTGPFCVYKYEISTNEGAYHLGARDLLEYIAYAIEQKFHPSAQAVPALPYRSVDLVFEHHSLSEATPFQRLAVAEYCLLNDNPVHRLFVVLNDLNTEQGRSLLQASEHEFATSLLAKNWTAKGQPQETIAGKLNRRFKELRGLLLSKFPRKSFPAVYDWIDKTIDYVSAQVAGKLLFARLYAMDANSFHLCMTTYLHVIGIPLIMNRHHELGSSIGGEEAKDQFIQLLLAFEFNDYLKSDALTCPLLSQCERYASNLVDEDCDNGPFRRAQDDQHCPFAAFVKAHGIDKLSWHEQGRLIPSLRNKPRW